MNCSHGDYQSKEVLLTMTSFEVKVLSLDSEQKG